MKEYPVTVNFSYQERHSRVKTFFRLILVIPHIIVIYFIAIAAAVILFLSWWAIMFTGKYPKGMFNFVAGFTRWSTRVNSYCCYLTDEYPPFSLE